MRADRVLPRTLFGRLMALFILGPLLMQIVSILAVATYLDDEYLKWTSLQIAANVRDATAALDIVPRDQRAVAAAKISRDGTHVTIVESTIAAFNSQRNAQSRNFEALIRAKLDDSHGVKASVEDAKSPNMMEIIGIRGRSPDNLDPAIYPQFQALVTQADGTQILFRFRPWLRDVPEDALAGVARDLSISFTIITLIAFFASRLLTRPLAKVATAAKTLGADLRRPPMQESGPKEVREVTRAFNEMQQRLIRFIDDRTRMLAAISHDLRTPLTRLRLRLEMLEPSAPRTRAIGDVEDMRQMLDESLDFVLGLQNPEPQAWVSVLKLLEDIQTDFPLGASRIEISGFAVPFVGRPLALKRCLTNLIENAVRYGDIARVNVIEQGGQIQISIQDKGPGIPQEKLRSVFNPYERVEGSRNRESGGIGLGLTIALEVAHLHGGSITLRNLSGGGLEACLLLRRTPENIDLIDEDLTALMQPRNQKV